MRTETDIFTVYNKLTNFLAFPYTADWNFPEQDLKLKYDEVNTTIKILKWVLNNNNVKP